MTPTTSQRGEMGVIFPCAAMKKQPPREGFLLHFIVSMTDPYSHVDAGRWGRIVSPRAAIKTVAIFAAAAPNA